MKERHGVVFTFVRRASGGGAKRYIPASRRKMSSARHARPSGVASAPGAIWTGSCTGGIGLQIADVLHCCRFRQYHLARTRLLHTPSDVNTCVMRVSMLFCYSDQFVHMLLDMLKLCTLCDEEEEANCTGLDCRGPFQAARPPVRD